MAYVYVKNEHDALDVIQDVAYQSFKNIKLLKHSEYVKTWFIKITIHASIQLLRKKEKLIPFDLANRNYEPSTTSDFTLPLTLEDLLDKLDEDEKSMIILRFYVGYSLKEISEILKIPLSTVKSTIYRTLVKLRKKSGGKDIYGY